METGFFYIKNVIKKVGGQWKAEMVTLTENFERRLQVLMLMLLLMLMLMLLLMLILMLLLALILMLIQEAGKRNKELKGKIAGLKVEQYFISIVIHHLD